MMRKVAICIALPLLITACGRSGPLEPPKGSRLPPPPYAASESPTPQELLTPDAQQRPGRSDELLRRSERRDADPFDLPPGTDPASVPLDSDQPADEAREIPVPEKTVDSEDPGAQG